MSKRIKFKSEEYPLNFNFLVFKNWETESGLKISELGKLAENAGAIEAVNILSLLYFAIVDACEEQEIDFPYKLKDFIRGVNPSELAELTSLIDIGGDSENKGQPKKPKLKQA